MPPDRILKFPRSDNKSLFVLVQVTSNGSNPLDVKLVATEGEAAYVTTCKSQAFAYIGISKSGPSFISLALLLDLEFDKFSSKTRPSSIVESQELPRVRDRMALYIGCSAKPGAHIGDSSNCHCPE